MHQRHAPHLSVCSCLEVLLARSIKACQDRCAAAAGVAPWGGGGTTSLTRSATIQRGLRVFWYCCAQLCLCACVRALVLADLQSRDECACDVASLRCFQPFHTWLLVHTWLLAGQRHVCDSWREGQNRSLITRDDNASVATAATDHRGSRIEPFVRELEAAFLAAAEDHRSRQTTQ
jgi:hypothetical protein